MIENSSCSAAEISKVLTSGGKPDVPTWSGIGDFDVVRRQFICLAGWLVLIWGDTGIVLSLRSSNSFYHPHPGQVIHMFG